MFETFVNTYGLQLLMAIFTAIGGFVGLQVKKLYQKFIDNQTKKDVATTVVKAIRQIYQDLDGSSKYQKAAENIYEMLTAKGIEITALEMDMLIEAAVDDFNMAFNGKEITTVKEGE